MIVIHGKENLDTIDKRYTALELETMLIKEGMEPVTHYAILTPEDVPFENLSKLKQYIPVHEALIKNYREKNWSFCLQAIEKLKGNIDPFMDTFYDILESRINKQVENPNPDWTHILDVS